MVSHFLGLDDAVNAMVKSRDGRLGRKGGKKMSMGLSMSLSIIIIMIR